MKNLEELEKEFSELLYRTKVCDGYKIDHRPLNGTTMRYFGQIDNDKTRNFLSECRKLKYLLRIDLDTKPSSLEENLLKSAESYTQPDEIGVSIIEGIPDMEFMKYGVDFDQLDIIQINGSVVSTEEITGVKVHAIEPTINGVEHSVPTEQVFGIMGRKEFTNKPQYDIQFSLVSPAIPDSIYRVIALAYQIFEGEFPNWKRSDSIKR